MTESEPLDIDKIRQEIQQKHLIHIDRDDPILAIATLIDLLLSRSSEHLTNAMTQALIVQLTKSKQIGENIVNNASEFIAQTTEKNINNIVDTAIINFKKSLEESLEKQEKALKEQQDLLNQAIEYNKKSWYGACISLVGGGIFFGLIISHIFF